MAGKVDQSRGTGLRTPVWQGGRVLGRARVRGPEWGMRVASVGAKGEKIQVPRQPCLRVPQGATPTHSPLGNFPSWAHPQR